MPPNKPILEPPQPDHPRSRSVVLGACVALFAAVAAVFFGPGMLSTWARQRAARWLERGAVYTAQRWVARSAWFAPGDGGTQLAEAACYRHLQRWDLWRASLQSAQDKGVPVESIRREIRLGLVQSGQRPAGSEGELTTLIETGVSPPEAAAAVMYGYLAREEPEKAKLVLDGWEADFPEDARVAYMAGVYWRWLAEPARAEKQFRLALAREPRHELARAALAGMLEEQNRLGEALEQQIELARNSDDANSKLGLARLLRKLGHTEKAREVLMSLASGPEPPTGLALELEQVELDCGIFAAAQRWFEQVDSGQAPNSEALAGAAVAWALQYGTRRSERLFARLDAIQSRSMRIFDLRLRLIANPRDKDAADELNRLSRSVAVSDPDENTPGIADPGEPQSSGEASARDLYAQHCAACHGNNGDGNGRAARHLFPKPRDLCTGRTRLVSTRNGVPTLKDIETVLHRGMPGTSMRSFDNLSPQQRKLLAQEVLRMKREGVRAQLIEAWKEEGETIDEDELRESVEFCTTPSQPVAIPQIGPARPEAVAKGQEVYRNLGCDKCHGEDGTGAWDPPLFDEKGRPSPPRDLVHEPFKGGHEPESLYLRIIVGMPGTPHPACCNVPDEQLIELVHYCLSLSRAPKRTTTNHERAARAATRPCAGVWTGVTLGFLTAHVAGERVTAPTTPLGAPRTIVTGKHLMDGPPVRAQRLSEY